MGIIVKLSDEVVSQIAAGEVIERPSYVVKELIENSIDAGASDIEVNLEDFGLTKIEILDDGFGMSKDDLFLSIKPHTTSKIKNIEDLHHIHSLGFRGEALMSIDSVSSLTIATKQHDSSKGYLLSKNNNHYEVSPIGINSGTKVTVTNLFKNVPARKKFLKSNVTELRLIAEVVTQYAFSHPDINFKLTNNGRILIDEVKNNLSQRIANLWGEDFTTQMLHIDEMLNTFSIRGFIGKPQLSIETTNKLWIYVNKRRVVNQLVASAIREAFGTLLMTRAYPVGIIFIEIPPQLIDVNIHPTKKEVKFVYSNEVFNGIKESIQNLLLKNNLTYQNIGFKQSSLTLKNELMTEVNKSEISKLGKTENNNLLQIHRSFIISETLTGFQIIDQHAAHESLLYFEFLNAWEKKRGEKKALVLKEPLLLDLSTEETLLLEEYKENIGSIGFEIDGFGKKIFRVTKIPSLYEDQNIKEVLLNLLSALSEGHSKMSEKEHHFLATLACKSAIKAGAFLTKDQRERLVNSLSEKNYAYTCPHGRPVKIDVTIGQLERMFKRK